MTEKQEGIVWDIRREGRAWTAEEFPPRAECLMGLDLEISRGKLLNEESRRVLLCMLLENVGMDAAVRLGDPERWRAAVARLDQPASEERTPPGS